MCVQAIGLIAAEIERTGIPTVAISLLKEVTNIIKPPRSLFVPFQMGFPMGLPNDTTLQHRVIASALQIFTKNESPNVDFSI